MQFKFLSPLLLITLAYSCNQKELDAVAPKDNLSAESTSLASTSNLLFQENFEGSDPFSSAVKLQVGSWDYAFNQTTSPVYNGLQSGRFELRDTDPTVSGGTRAEALVVGPAANKNRWYSFAAYFPKDGYKFDSSNEVINQWYQMSGTTQATTLRIASDRFYLQTGNNSSSLKKIDLGPVTKDSWHQFVFHFIHSYGSDGLIEVWHNGSKVLTHTGGNMYDAQYPNWKLGVYKSKWNSSTTDTDKRVLYYDDIKVGNENATYADMSTASSVPTEPTPTEPTPTEPTPTDPTPTEPEPSTNSYVNSITLVNAQTEQDVKEMSDGDAISFRAFGTRKVNFRANPGSEDVKSIKFELSGSMTYTSVESTAPYALFGDDNKGNYYYGALTLPTGDYTLKATPYSETKGAGTAGEPYTVRFSINK